MLQGSVDKIPWKKLLSRKEVWAIILSHFCHNWGVFILLTWMPSYYSTVLGFDLASAGLAAVYPWLCMAIMANLGGFLADRAVTKGVDRTVVRKTMQTIGFMGPAFFLTQLRNVHDPVTAVLCMCACQGLDAFSQSGLYSNHQVCHLVCKNIERVLPPKGCRSMRTSTRAVHASQDTVYAGISESWAMLLFVPNTTNRILGACMLTLSCVAGHWAQVCWGIVRHDKHRRCAGRGHIYSSYWLHLVSWYVE